MGVINSAAPDLPTAVCVHVCDELHYTCPIGLSLGLRHSSVPQHKANWWDCLLLTVRRTRSPLKQLPRGQVARVQTPQGAEHMDTMSKHNMMHHHLLFVHVCVCGCVRTLPVWWISLKQCYSCKFSETLTKSERLTGTFMSYCGQSMDRLMAKILDVSQQTSECIFMPFTQVIVFNTFVKIIFCRKGSVWKIFSFCQ